MAAAHLLLDILATMILVLVAFPVLTAGLFGLEIDRHFGAHVFDPANGGAILWQHLFWFFGHPEVYIVALPFFGIITEIMPVFSRKPLFGYRGMVFATMGITGLSAAVWAHHMFATGAVVLPFFCFMTFLIAIPTGLKFFNWIGTMWRGQVSFQSPMLFTAGFLVTFLFGGLTGVILAAPALDFHVTDSYFVVAHFHYVLFGTIVPGQVPDVVFATTPGSTSGSPRPPAASSTSTTARCTSGPPSSGSTSPSWSSTGSALWACSAATPTTYPPTASPHSTTSPPSEHSCLAHRSCRSSGTSCPPGGTVNPPPPMTPGVTATLWSGSPVHHRPGTTSTCFPASAPNAPPSNCTTRKCVNECTPKPTRTATGSPCKRLRTWPLGHKPNLNGTYKKGGMTMHRETDRPDQTATEAASAARPATRPDFSRTDLQRPERMARIGEAPEPNFATKDIDLARPPAGNSRSEPIGRGPQRGDDIGSVSGRQDELERRLDALTLRFEALESSFHQNSPYSQIADAPGVRTPHARS